MYHAGFSKMLRWMAGGHGGAVIALADQRGQHSVLLGVARTLSSARRSESDLPKSIRSVWRIAGGNVSSISAWRLGAPTAWSFSAISLAEGRCGGGWQNHKDRSWQTSGGLREKGLTDQLGVGCFVHKAVEVGGISELDFVEPARAERVGVDERGVLHDRVVDFDDIAAQRA